MTTGRRIGVSAASAAFLYSAAGLIFGNIPRFRYLLGDKGFSYALLGVVGAAFAAIATFLIRAALRRRVQMPALDWRGAAHEAASLVWAGAVSGILLIGAFLAVVVWGTRDTFLLIFPFLALFTVAVVALFILAVLQRLTSPLEEGQARAARAAASLAWAGAAFGLLLMVPLFIAVNALNRKPGAHLGLYALLALVVAAVAAPLILAVWRRLSEPLTLVMSWASRASASMSLAGAAGGLFLAGLFWPAVGGIALSRATEEVRAAGYPVVMPFTGPKLPDEENGAFYYEKLNSLASLADAKEREAESLFLKEFLERASAGAAHPSDYPRARRVVARHTEGLRMLELGAARPRADWDITWDYDPIWERPVPRYYGLLMMSRVAAARAVIMAHEGRTREALESVRFGLTAARSLEHQGLLLGAMVQRLIVNDTLNAGRIVLRSVPSELANARWRPLLDADAVEKEFWLGVGREHFAETLSFSQIAWWDIVFGKYRSLDVDERVYGIPLIARGSKRVYGVALLTCYWPFMKLDMASALRGRLELVRIMRTPALQRHADSDDTVGRALRTMWTLGNISTRNYGSLHAKALTAVANIRLARAALAARRFNEERGRWPRSVDEIEDYSKEKFDDPFAAAPLGLSEVGKRPVLYSVGPDGKDDEGAPYDDDRMSGDLSWRL